MNKNIRHIVPSLSWVKKYSWNHFAGDSSAGFTVAIMLIPQCMAYALLAGLPAEMGLYTCLIPMIVYALFGGSPYLSVGPVAISSIIIAQTIGPLAQGDPLLMIQMVSLLAFLEGLIQVTMGSLRLGFIFNFLSIPVIYGYISSAAITIILSQFNNLFGIEITKSELPFLNFYRTLELWEQIHYPTLMISFSVIVILFYSKNYLSKHLIQLIHHTHLSLFISRLLPALLIIVAIAWMKYFPIQGVLIIGKLPTGLPSLQLPFTTLEIFLMLVPIAFYLCLISYMESISVASTLNQKSSKSIDPNREFNALGLANITSSFTGGYSVSGSLSRSVLNLQSGAKTPLSSIFTALFILLVILFLMPYLHFLPQTILSSIIIVAIYNMVKLPYFLKILKLSKTDAFCFLATFLSVFFFGIKHGLVTGIITSIVTYIWITSRPHIAVIGRIKGTEHFRNILRFQVETFPEILILRIDENLHFANSRFFLQKFNQLLLEKPQTKHLIMNACNVNLIDTSALETLTEFFKQTKQKGIQCYLSEIKGPVYDFLSKTSFLEEFEKKNIFLSTHLALNQITQDEKK